MAAAAVTQKPSATAQPDPELESAALKYAQLVVKVANFSTWTHPLIQEAMHEKPFKGSLVDENALLLKVAAWQEGAIKRVSSQALPLLQAAYKTCYKLQKLKEMHVKHSLHLAGLGQLVNKAGFEPHLTSLRTQVKEDLLIAIGALPS